MIQYYEKGNFQQRAKNRQALPSQSTTHSTDRNTDRNTDRSTTHSTTFKVFLKTALHPACHQLFMTVPSTICVLCQSSLATQRQKAKALARALKLPFEHAPEEKHSLHLVYTDNRLELQYNPLLRPSKMGPVSVDFLHRGYVHPRLRSLSRKDPLARAVGIQSGKRPIVVDATAGLGTDGITLAWLGCKVTLIERSPIIHALLHDGLDRAGHHPTLQPIITENIRLLQGDSTEILQHLEIPPHTVYLDPMYPHLKKERRRKKEMRIVRETVGDDGNNAALLRTALQTTAHRVVVKRPKSAEPLCTNPRPSHHITMKSGRFDVYLV